MRKIVIGMHAGMAGTDAWEFYLVPESVTDEELSEFAWTKGKENAEMYGVYPREEYLDEPDFEEDLESYSDNIEGWCEKYNANKHDSYSMTGTPDWQTY